MDEKTYISRQGVELVNPVVVEQRQLDKLRALLLALRNEHKDCCCSKCEDITARIDEALLGKGRPVPPHGSGP